MIEIAVIGLALLAFAALGVSTLSRRWNRDRCRLTREVSDLTTHALVLQEGGSQAIVKFETSGPIRIFNSAAEKLFGYSALEMLGQSIVTLVPEALAASRLAETLEIRRKDGPHIRLPFRAAKMNSGTLSYIYLFFEDHAKEESGVGASSLQSLSQTARIVGRIAGQFEPLLTTISGYSELALRATPESSPVHRDLQEIVTASERASSLTRHLGAFSGTQLIPVEPVDLNRLVTNMQTQLRQAVPCPIDFDLQPMDKASLANGEYLQEVILLLCGSARGRMRDNDRLQVRTGRCNLTKPRLVQSGELRPGPYGVLTISDSGRPLDAGIKEHLFEPLYLSHKDVGVELSPIYGIVHSLGGGMDVVSGDDAGTTFEILLPCVSSARVAHA